MPGTLEGMRHPGSRVVSLKDDLQDQNFCCFPIHLAVRFPNQSQINLSEENKQERVSRKLPWGR